jgi:hypothetical protein
MFHMTDIPGEREADERKSDTNAERRRFLQGAVTAGALGVAGMTSAFAQSSQTSQEPETQRRAELRQDIMGRLEADEKEDLDVRAKATEELATPSGLRQWGMLDERFPVCYETSVPQAMGLVTQYFAALSRRDLEGVTKMLHFPYATYELGIEPLVYRSAEEFISNPPPSMNMSTKPDNDFRFAGACRPGMYDIMDNLQLHTFNPVNVGLELCYTRYRADGYRLGINEGIYGVTNNDGKWGIQLSSVIFTPTEFIGVTYNDAIEAHLRQGRSSMAPFGERDWDLLTSPDSPWAGPHQRSPKKTASIGGAGAPGAATFSLSATAGKPMEPYNSSGIKSRLVINDPKQPRSTETNAGMSSADPVVQADRRIQAHNIRNSKGTMGWLMMEQGGGVGYYGYVMSLPNACVLHASPIKAHALGGYIRYTPENVFISETRSLGIMVYDLAKGGWDNGGGFGQVMRRDRTNDASPLIGSLE